MTKEILVQYSDLQEEIKDIRKRIQADEAKIEKIESEGSVIDTVSCGKRGKKPIGTGRIEGFPYPEYSKNKTKLYIHKAQLEMAEEELLELTNSVEDYIQSVADSRIRRILRYRFIDGMTWAAVSINMGGRTTEESARKEFERFFAQE